MLRRVFVFVLPLLVLNACGSSDQTTIQPSCNYALSSLSASAPSAGTTASFTVTKTAGGSCSWTATADVPWISISPTSSSNDSATLSYTVAANGGSGERVGHVGVSWTGGSGTFAVTQQGVAQPPPTCTYTVGDATPSSFAVTGGTGSIPVTVAGSACGAWNATTSASWIHITAGSGTATGNVAFSVDAAGSSRNDKITVTFPGGSKDVAVVQGGASCSLTVASGTQSAPASGGSFNASVGSNCAWSATADVPWITITSGSSGASNGTIAYTVAASIATSSRIGHINISGTGQSAQVTVTQACGLCAVLSVSPTPCNVAPTGSGTNKLSCTFDGSASTGPSISNYEFRLVNPSSGPVLGSGASSSVANPTVPCGQGGLPGNGDTVIDVYLTITTSSGTAQDVKTITFRRNSAC